MTRHGPGQRAAGIAGQRRRPWLQRTLTALLTALLLVGSSALTAVAQSAQPASAPRLAASRGIPISQQAFYPDLLRAAAHWADAPLGEVVADNPRDTLLNFYAVMARVDHDRRAVIARAGTDSLWRWSPAQRQRIAITEDLFALAVKALDASEIPESIREDQAQEAAIQLKQVLDYVLGQNDQQIEIPNSAELKALNQQRSRSSESWTLPKTGITLSAGTKAEGVRSEMRFSAGTVAEIGRMYALIASAPVAAQPFATPDFYQTFSDTPGFLVPPKWYVRLSPELRQRLEYPVAGQTLFQLVAAAITLLLYGWIVLLLLQRLLGTYRYYQPAPSPRPDSWHQDNVAWYRVLLTLPVMPLTWICHRLIDDLMNFTGDLLIAVTVLFFSCSFIAASVVGFFLFEALGRTLAERLVQLRGGGSELQLRRVSNLVMPVSRVLGGLVALALIYRLLIMLGLPANTVLAFSAVPGLAIGLGASKLLGNLFAGLSIQTDRPVRVGEFCRIGDNLGFVTRIGLRSLELQTIDSRVTIPNAIADEETIVNFTQRQRGGEQPLQTITLNLTVQDRFSPEQVNDLLTLVRRELQRSAVLQQPMVSLQQEGMEAFTLISHGVVAVSDWQTYLQLREQLLLRLDELVEQVRLSQRQIGVSYATSASQLERLPQLIRAVVERDPEMALQSCRLMAISDFSYDYSFRLIGSQQRFSAFKDAIDRLNRDLLRCFDDEGIEIPYPTAVEIKRDA